MNQINQALKNIERITEPMRKMQQSMQQSMQQAMQPTLDAIERLNAFYAPQIEQIAKILEGLPERTQKAIMILANEGWFVDAEFAMSSLLNIEYKTTKEIEELLISYYENNTDSIEKKLIERFPKRTSILKQAFYAHNNEMYELSVPVFLIQSDGICLDMTGYNFFHKKYELKKHIESNLSDNLFDEYLKPLMEKIPLSLHENDRDENFNKLNRHMVLHGESYEYATKSNSLKSISFMAYLLEFLENDIMPTKG
jgi:hypothetical protein